VSQIDRLRRCADREAGILMDRTDVRELLAEIDAQPDGVDKFPKREQKIIVAYKGDIDAIADEFPKVGRL
jgi:hypothetical protein